MMVPAMTSAGARVDLTWCTTTQPQIIFGMRFTRNAPWDVTERRPFSKHLTIPHECKKYDTATRDMENHLCGLYMDDCSLKTIIDSDPFFW